jgi:hypothetical protein
MTSNACLQVGRRHDNKLLTPMGVKSNYLNGRTQHYIQIFVQPEGMEVYSVPYTAQDKIRIRWNGNLGRHGTPIMGSLIGRSGVSLVWQIQRITMDSERSGVILFTPLLRSPVMGTRRGPVTAKSNHLHHHQSTTCC